MSKYTDSGELTESSFARGARSRKSAIEGMEHAMGTVMKVLPGNEVDKRGIGDVLVQIKNTNAALETHNVSPLNPFQFTVPLPNELVHCIKDGLTGDWYYTGIAPNRGLINFLINGHQTIELPDGDDGKESNGLYTGDYFQAMPNIARSLDVFEGTTLLQGRFGQSLRFDGSNPELNEVPWKSSQNSASPITILRNGYVPIEQLNADASSIYLTSDQELEIPLQVPLPTDLENSKDTFGKPQIILYSDRLVLGTTSDSIILSSADSIALCTPNWQHDVDSVLNIMEELIGEVEKIASEVRAIAQASATQTFPVPIVGSTLLSVQSPAFSTSTNKAITIGQKLKQMKSNLDTLKQK